MTVPRHKPGSSRSVDLPFEEQSWQSCSTATAPHTALSISARQLPAQACSGPHEEGQLYGYRIFQQHVGPRRFQRPRKSTMSAPSFANFVVKRPWLRRWMQPLATWYVDAAGYRKLGLRADDLIPEESPEMQLALKRLSPKEAYDRVYRMRRAFQCSLTHTLLPRNEWTKPDEDYPYLQPIIRQIEQEKAERHDLDSMVIKRPGAAQ